MGEKRAFHRLTGASALVVLSLFMPLDTSADTYRLPLLPPASDALREGMVRIVNHSDESGQVAVTAIDDSGLVLGPIALEVEAGQTIRFSSADLERGNDALGIATGIGTGQGDWRLVLDTSLDIEPLAYVHTSAGFVDSLHDVVPRPSFYHRVTLLAPDSGLPDGSAVRLINPTDAEAGVTIFGVDDENALAPGLVSIALAAGAARTVNARELENGAVGLAGRLGDGAGDWQLLIFTDAAIEAMTVLDTASGPLANLSAARVEEGSVLLFLSAGDALNEGRLRITNRSAAGEIRIHAVDDTGQSYGPVTMSVDGRKTVTLSSNDLETGNAEKGLPIGLGSGEGDWRLVLESELNLDVFAYARSQDGVVSIAHNVAAEGRRRHHVPFFNPAGETGRQSRLRLINPSEGAAQIAIQAWDDAGDEAPEGAVSLSLASGASTSLSAESLEDGANGLSGSFGEGQGGWRLAVQADRDIQVMSLVKDTAGHLTNLSTSSTRPSFLDPCVGGPEDVDGDGVSDRCDREPGTVRTLERCSDGSYVTDPDGNPGLVSDCRVLVGFANYKAQGEGLPADHVLRRWGMAEQSRIGSWVGVAVSDGRVTAIRLTGTADEPGGLTGIVPPALGQLTGLTVLDLSGNGLPGPIPWELGNLANLQTLDLSDNQFTGSIPPELANLAQLSGLYLQLNRFTGTVPRAIWERIVRRELAIRYDGNAIRGFEPSPEDSTRPVYSGNAADNGNAAHHSVSYYQGPLVWEWDWLGDPAEHQRPVLGGWAALAVRIDHEVAVPPLVITRVLDRQGSVLSDRLAEAAPPSTVSTASGGWRTEYVFELPGNLYQSGNQLVHVIDPDDDLAETNEEDNTGEPIHLYGDELSPFRATFFPLYYRGDEPPTVDAELLMSGTRAYLPIADNFHVEIASARQSDAANLSELLDEIRALWNAEGSLNEYYHGVYVWPWLGDDARAARTAGLAELSGNVAVSTISSPNVIPHEFGHNFGLRHTPGCSATSVDFNYPYPDGGLGPRAGWDVNWRRLVSNDDEGHTDLMSYCGQYAFVSDYSYRNALNNRLRTRSATGTLGVQPFTQSGGTAQRTPRSANQSSSGTRRTTPESDAGGGLALSGRIGSSGEWSLTHAQSTDRGPRAPAPDGPFTLILFDGDGVEFYREPLSIGVLSDGGEAGWAARTPVPTRPVRQAVILDAQGVEVLREALQVSV